MLQKALGKFVGRNWRGQQIALILVAAELSQCRQLPLRFHPLGSHTQVQAVGHGDDGPDDGGVVGIRLDVAHEGAVDLQRIDRQLFQIGERRIARSEIVHRE